MTKAQVLRGGSYRYVSWYLRTTIRIRSEPESRFRYDGFRIVVRRRKKQ
jgi:formylglycine-generating enzyme required for sulfatase activity